MSSLSEYFPGTISRDLISIIVEDKPLAVGSTRTVFKGALTPGNVFKFETLAKRFQNAIEWEVWEIVKHTKHKIWFAPCITISDCGTILVQAYCRNLEDHELPEELPAYFADIKRENFGWYNGHVVCRDYGNNYLVDNSLNKKMKKVEW